MTVTDIRARMPKHKKLDFRIRNVDGARSVDLTLEPGVVELVGPNEAGKTSTLRAIARAAGGDHLPLTPTDGCKEGIVETPWNRLVVRKAVKITAKKGEEIVSLADGTALAELIDPPHKGQGPRDNARIRSLLRLIDVPVDDRAVETLCDNDPTLCERVIRRVREQQLDDLLAAADATHGEGCALARDFEDEEAEARGRVASLRSVAESILTDEIGSEDRFVDDEPQEIQRLQHGAEIELERAIQRRQSADDLIVKQQRIRETLEDEPDLMGAQVELASCQALLDRAEDEYRKAGERLQQAKAEVAQAQDEVDRRRAIGDRRKGQLAILEEEISAPSEDAIEGLRLAVSAHRNALHRAEATRRYRSQVSQADAAEKEREKLAERATKLREIAKTVRDRMASLVESTDSPFTVSGGALAVKRPDGRLEAYDRLSAGAQVRFAVELAARRWSGRMVWLPADHWNRLQPERQREIDRLAEENFLYVVTERPADGELHQERPTSKEVAS